MPDILYYPRDIEPYVKRSDPWEVFRPEGGEEAASCPPGKVIVPFSWWTSYSQHTSNRERINRGEISVWVGVDVDILAHRQLILEAIPSWGLIAVDFPVFKDGRGYSTAALLREHFNYDGELRAIGDVLVDQLYLLARVGFDSFKLRNDQSFKYAIREIKGISIQLQDAWRFSRQQPTLSDSD